MEITGYVVGGEVRLPKEGVYCAKKQNIVRGREKPELTKTRRLKSFFKEEKIAPGRKTAGKGRIRCGQGCAKSEKTKPKKKNLDQIMKNFQTVKGEPIV